MILFGITWFRRYQRALLWFCNAPVVKYWFRWVLRIHRDLKFNEKIHEIGPNYYKVKIAHNKIRIDCRTHPKFSKRLYYAFSPLWWTFHFWDWLVADRFIPELSLGFATTGNLFPQAGSGGANTTCDAYSEYVNGAGQTWASIIGQGTATTISNTAALLQVGATSHGATNGRFTSIERAWADWVTSSIGATSCVDSAICSVFGNGNKKNDLGSPGFEIVSSGQTTANVFVASDFGSGGTTDFGSVTYANFLSGYTDISLTAAGLNGINKSGITKFCFKTTWDAQAAAPTWIALKQSWLIFQSADTSGTSQDPKLVVIYYLLPATPTATAATGITETGFTANWTGDSIATGYRLDVAEDAAFTVYVSGYQDLAVSAGTTKTQAVTDLIPGVKYYYRVRAEYGTCRTGNSSTITVTTTAAPQAVILKYSTTAKAFLRPLRVKGFDPGDHFRMWPGTVQDGMDGSRSVIVKGFCRVFTIEFGVITYAERLFLNAFFLADETYIRFDLQTTWLRIELENAEQWENEWLNNEEYRFVRLVLVDKYLHNLFSAVNIAESEIMYLKRHVKIEGTETSPETFTTNSGKLATDETGQTYPVFSDTTHVFHVEVNGTPYQDAKIHIITQPSVSGGNLTWTAAVSGSGNMSSDGSAYADVCILLQAKP